MVSRGLVIQRPAFARLGVPLALFFAVAACGGKAERVRERSRNGQGGGSATGGSAGSATGGSGGVTGGATSGGTSSGGSSGDAGAAGEPMGGSGGDGGCVGGDACAEGLECDAELGCVRVCDAVGMDAVVLVTTQAELEDIAACNVIDGQLWIRGASITDLRPLGALRRVTDELAIIDCAELESLAGLTSLERVGSLGILTNERLPSLDGLEALRAIGGGPINHTSQSLAVNGNAVLSDLDLSALETVSNQLTINANPVLPTLGDLSALESVALLEISYNPSLPQCEVDALDARLQACGDGQCEGNDSTATCD